MPPAQLGVQADCVWLWCGSFFCVLSVSSVCCTMLCVCAKLAACTGDAAQRLLSSHGVAGCLRRECHDHF